MGNITCSMVFLIINIKNYDCVGVGFKYFQEVETDVYFYINKKINTSLNYHLKI